MTGSIQCPHCAGNKVEVAGAASYKCLYCGTTFSVQNTSAINGQTPPPAPGQTQQPIIIVQPSAPQPEQTVHVVGGKSKSTAVLLAFFFGWLGISRFYVGDTGLGILYLLLTTIISIISLGLGFFIIGTILTLIDFFYFLCMSESTFNRKYNYR